jgi:hypothetical protein
VSLQWVRLDTGWYQNHKVLALIAEGARGHRALVVYVSAFCHSGAQGLDGFIPAYALPVVHGTARDAQLLVQHELWLEEAGGMAGWRIRDWGEYQPTSEETAARSERARQAALRRWSKREVKNHAKRNASGNA